jgi:hypothetical protein
MLGGKNWILPKEINQTVLLRLSLARDLEKPLMSLHGTERRERGYGLWADIQRRVSILAWIVILSVYGTDTIAIDLSLCTLIS